METQLFTLKLSSPTHTPHLLGIWYQLRLFSLSLSFEMFVCSQFNPSLTPRPTKRQHECMSASFRMRPGNEASYHYVVDVQEWCDIMTLCMCMFACTVDWQLECTPLTARRPATTLWTTARPTSLWWRIKSSWTRYWRYFGS